MKQQLQSLTEQESAFAAEHHSLIYHYLNKKGLPEDEYYDIVVFGYINGVRKYFRREELRQQYSFTTLAWSAMNACLSNYESAKARYESRAEVLCIHEPFHSAYALEEIISDARDYAEETLSAMWIKEALQIFEQTEREVVLLLMEGYPKSQIRRILSISAEELTTILSGIRIKTQNSPLMQAA